MEKRLLVEHMETNLLIKNTLESSLKSFNKFVPFNMNMLMQQRLHSPSQPAPPPSTTVVPPQPLLLEPMVLASKATITVDPVLAPPSPFSLVKEFNKTQSENSFDSSLSLIQKCSKD